MNIDLLVFILVFVLVFIIDFIGYKRNANDFNAFLKSIYQKITTFLMVPTVIIGRYGFSKILEKQISDSNKLFWLSFAISLSITLIFYTTELLILKNKMKKSL